MDPTRRVRPAQADRTGLLRPDRRPGPRSDRRGRLHHQGARTRRGRRPPTGRPRQTGRKRSGTTDGYGIPLGRVLAGANRHDSPLLAPTLDRLEDLGPVPDDITVHLDAGYESDKTRALLSERCLRGRVAHKGENAPVQASQRWHVERTRACQNAFYRPARCYEWRTTVIDAFFDPADTIITVRSPIRQAWATGRVSVDVGRCLGGFYGAAFGWSRSRASATAAVTRMA
nr:transposase [Kitasatospora sp. MMS16-BH015]